jgi:hypothetical protein
MPVSASRSLKIGEPLVVRSTCCLPDEDSNNSQVGVRVQRDRRRVGKILRLECS